MNNDLSSYFEDPEFKDLLAKYEGMVENHTPTYFDAEEPTSQNIMQQKAKREKRKKSLISHYACIPTIQMHWYSSPVLYISKVN